MNPIRKITQLGTNDPLLDNWERRNLRFMNSMAFTLMCTMIMFFFMGLIFDIKEAFPQLTIAFTSIALFFLVRHLFSMGVAKIYFSILPTFIVTLFAITVVGSEGNDKYFLSVVIIVPLILFKNKTVNLLFAIFNLSAFFLITYFQTIITPLRTLDEFTLGLYESINGAVMFMLIILLIRLFKKEISGYQQEIEDQKSELEEKNNDITQSIEYARKIQDAILPPEDLVKQHLPENFILYLPKDIVAGDFYWMEHINGKTFFAVADCTGHGVPGAMVSVVCHNALNRAVREFGLTVPSKILDKTRELVIETFKQSNRQVKDGMDIGLCLVDSTNKTVEFAGANNGLYKISEGELTEIKADKQPIGFFENASEFTNHRIEFNTGDSFYLFTDGYADQFGGPKGKKFKYKTFKDLLISLSTESKETQRMKLENTFHNWRGELEQIDDVCVVGISF